MTDLPLFDPFKALAEIRRQAEERDALSQKLPQAPARANHEQDQSVRQTSAASATSAGALDEHTFSRTRVNKKKEKNNIIISDTYAREGSEQDPSDEHTWDGAAEVARVAKVELSHCNQTDTAETEVAEVFDDGLRKWRSALAHLSPERSPCPGYRGDEWARTRARALDFLDTFGEQAEALGWTAPRLFGVHPAAGIVRVDACGALVLPSTGTVRAITATEISFGHLTHREKPGQPQGVPIWEFGR